MSTSFADRLVAASQQPRTWFRDYVRASPERDADMLRRLDAGESLKEIALSYDVTVEALRAKLRKIKSNSDVETLNNPVAKFWAQLVPDEVAKKQAAWERSRDMARAKACGLSAKEISVRFHVSVSYVNSILKDWDNKCFAQKSGEPKSPVEKWTNSSVASDLHEEISEYREHQRREALSSSLLRAYDDLVLRRRLREAEEEVVQLRALLGASR